jgi:hypothetical protein
LGRPVVQAVAALRTRLDLQPGTLMIGFPGTQYDYRDWIERHDQRVTLPTVAINNHPNWVS